MDPTTRGILIGWAIVIILMALGMGMGLRCVFRPGPNTPWTLVQFRRLSTLVVRTVFLGLVAGSFWRAGNIEARFCLKRHATI
jgi:hypothetical protein